MVIIDKEKCVGCGKCASDCVARNIEIVDKKAVIKDMCLQCGHCVAICNCDAVSIPEYDMDDVEAVDPSKTIAPDLLLSYIKSRRSIRDFTSQKVSEENMKLMAEAGRYTATANNGQFHKYIFVQEELDTLKKFVWDFIGDMKPEDRQELGDYSIYKEFLRRRNADSTDDYLFRNAPAVLFITSQRMLDAGMAAQNMEMMACSLGMGALYNGFMVRIVDTNLELKKWLGIENETVCACLLLGYPKQKYVRTAPRKKAEVITR